MKKTNDTLFDGRLVCKQHQDGYRFSIDSVLLAHFVHSLRPTVQLLDLCCGSGVIGFILAHRNPGVSVTGLELQPSLAKLASENSKINNFSERYRLIEGDARKIEKIIEPETFDIIVCNPPYRKGQTGRLSQHSESAAARHELSGTIKDFVHAAGYSVQNRGRVYFIFPAARSSVIISCMEQRNLAVKKLQFIYSYPKSEKAALVLVEGVKNGGEECEVLSPFFIYTRKNGPYSDAMARMYR